MDKEKKRKHNLVLNGIAIPISVFALYTFIFVFDNGIGWKNGGGNCGCLLCHTVCFHLQQS